MLNKIEWIKKLRDLAMTTHGGVIRPGLKESKDYVEEFYAAVEQDIRQRDALTAQLELAISEMRDITLDIQTATAKKAQVQKEIDDLSYKVDASRRFASPHHRGIK